MTDRYTKTYRQIDRHKTEKETDIDIEYNWHVQYQIRTYVNEIFKDGILIRTSNHEIYENYGFTTYPPLLPGSS